MELALPVHRGPEESVPVPPALVPPPVLLAPPPPAAGVGMLAGGRGVPSGVQLPGQSQSSKLQAAELHALSQTPSPRERGSQLMSHACRVRLSIVPAGDAPPCGAAAERGLGCELVIVLGCPAAIADQRSRPRMREIVPGARTMPGTWHARGSLG
eukprot:COSAG01_NODE_618_length_14800_cov_11.772396_6_plen_155_part_00